MWNIDMCWRRVQTLTERQAQVLIGHTHLSINRWLLQVKIVQSVHTVITSIDIIHAIDIITIITTITSLSNPPLHHVTIVVVVLSSTENKVQTKNTRYISRQVKGILKYFCGGIDLGQM